MKKSQHLKGKGKRERMEKEKARPAVQSESKKRTD